MALTAEQEKGVVAMLAAFQNGKRINELDAAKGALKDMRIEVMDETGETHSMELADAVAQAGNPIAVATGTPRTPHLRRRATTAVFRHCATCLQSWGSVATS